jgi:hypothetical protein
MITDKDIDQLMLQNQQGFDRMPSSKAWEQIGSSLEYDEIKEKNYVFRKWVSAASILLFVSLSYLFYSKFLEPNTSLSVSEMSPAPNEELLIAFENKKEEDNQHKESSPAIAPVIEKKVTKESNINNQQITITSTKEDEKEVEETKAGATTAQIKTKQISQPEISLLEKEAQQKSALLSQAIQIEEEIAYTEDLSEINRSNAFYKSALENESTTGISASRLGFKKDKSTSAKSKSAHVYDYYGGVWITKNHIENTTSKVFGNKITLVIEEDESVYVYGIDKETLPFKMTDINELHLSLTDADFSNIKISYLSAKEALLVYTDNEGKASLVLKRQ